MTTKNLILSGALGAVTFVGGFAMAQLPVDNVSAHNIQILQPHSDCPSRPLSALLPPSRQTNSIWMVTPPKPRSYSIR